MPSDQMRKAMQNARVGDDVAGEDPTVNELEALAASMLGFEEALYVPTGTMGNMVSLAAHLRRGDELILGTESHIFQYEAGGVSGAWRSVRGSRSASQQRSSRCPVQSLLAALLGAATYVLPNQADGTLALDAVRGAIREDDPHYPVTRAVAIENTQNRCNGRVYPHAKFQEVASLCKQHNLALHVDGARLANAAVASGVPLAAIASGATSVSLCLSKGLGCPVGAIVAGSGEFMYSARRARKALGGSMRQAGVIAATGIVALHENIDRLADDHRNCMKLARGLAAMGGIKLAGLPDTNILYFDVVEEEVGFGAEELCRRLGASGVRVEPYGRTEIRAVTHLNVSSEDIERVLAACEAALAS